MLDAVTDAKPICGDREKLEEVKKKVQEYVKKKGIVRTSHGWLPT